MYYLQELPDKTYRLMAGDTALWTFNDAGVACTVCRDWYGIALESGIESAQQRSMSTASRENDYDQLN